MSGFMFCCIIKLFNKSPQHSHRPRPVICVIECVLTDLQTTLCQTKVPDIFCFALWTRANIARGPIILYAILRLVSLRSDRYSCKQLIRNQRWKIENVFGFCFRTLDLDWTENYYNYQFAKSETLSTHSIGSILFSKNFKTYTDDWRVSF